MRLRLQEAKVGSECRKARGTSIEPTGLSSITGAHYELQGMIPALSSHERKPVVSALRHPIYSSLYLLFRHSGWQLANNDFAAYICRRSHDSVCACTSEKFAYILTVISTEK